ncbi:MAG: DUF6580 family putative transport protein [Gemmataceae bacterium]
MSPDRRQPVDLVAWGLCAAVAVQTVLCRVAPYYFGPWALWNFVPAGALALFAGSRLRTGWALLVPLSAMFVADVLLIGPIAAMGYSSISWGTPLLYACFAAYFGIGLLVPRDRFAPHLVLLAALAASAQFFVITNFAAWVADATLYTKDAAGLLNCYAAAVPFYRATFAADVAFGLGLFAAHAALVRLSSPVRQEQPA